MLKRQMKSLVIMTCMCMLVFFAAEGTSAYFSAEEKAHNVITTGSIEIEVEEWSKNENGEIVPFENVDGVMPGEEISKIVQIRNTGLSEAYVRVFVDKEIVLSDDSKGNVNQDMVNINFNTTDWTANSDGFYYYNKVLKPGEVTEPLFSSVIFDEKMDNDYKNASATIGINAYATQVANNGDSALTAKGWPGK